MKRRRRNPLNAVPRKPKPKGGNVTDIGGKIVTGKFYSFAILGELPPDMANMSEGEIARALFDGFSAKLTVVGTVRGYNLQLMTELPPSQPVVH